MKFNRITFIGHSGIILTGDDSVLAIDPWLEGNPSCPPDLINPNRIDFICLTHGHSDHASSAARLGKKLGAVIFATFELATLLGMEGVPEQNIIGMNKGGSVSQDGLTISLTHALHSNSYDFNGQALYAGEACGVVVSDGKNVVYHAGDTALFSDMRLISECYKPNIACLPIGDRFTMGPKEAAQAAKILKVSTVIPIHHSTFPQLTGTVEEFKDECKSLDVEIKSLLPGESFEI